MAYEFSGQLSDEEVILLTRQHPFALFKSWFFVGLLLLIPVAYFSLFNEVKYLFILIPACLILAGVKGYTSYSAWLNTVMLVTDKRIVILTQKNVMRKELISSGIDRIHRVTHEINGLFPTLFGYGNIAIATDDPTLAMVMKSVANPFDIQQEILRTLFESTN